MDPARALVTSPTIRNDSPAAADDWAMVVLVKGGIPVVVAIPQPTVGVTTTIPASAVPAIYLAANPNRLGAAINNNSPNRFLYIKLGGGVSGVSYSVRLGPHGYYELPFPAYVGVIEGVWTAGVGGFATVTELT